MFSRKALVAAIALFCCAGGAFAQAAGNVAATATSGNSTAADEIARINEDIAVLSARLKHLDLRAQIVTKQAEIDRAAATGGSANIDSTAPVVRGIEGVDGKLKATLAFTGGVQQTVSKGEVTRGGWTVSDISINSVSLSRGKERIKLGFGNEPPASTAAGQPMPGPAGAGGRPF
ncbi:MAG: type IV pilus biogenesis protein PilP [Anaerolineae bacterium]|nr:type IV pilus biogenesis protein PilP [Anaerolineae bacterium]